MSLNRTHLTQYEQLAEQVTDQIRDGLYRPGERLPSVRDMARREALSLTTVASAYGLLEQRRLVESRPRSGYFVRLMSSAALEPPRSCNVPAHPLPVASSQLMVDTLSVAHSDGVNLLTAYPHCEENVHTSLKRAFVRTAKHGHYLRLGYGPLEGELELRRQVARQALDYCVSTTADDIIMTAGCQEAITLALQALTNPGDVIAVESPCYPGFVQMIATFGLHAVQIPADPDTGLDLDALETALTRWPVRLVLAVPTFSNPLGGSMPPEHRKRLVSLLNMHDLPLIEDNIYADLAFDHHYRAAVKAFDTEKRVILCGSLSKSLDPKFRTGWIIPGCYYSEVLHQKYVSTLGMPTMAQLALANWLDGTAFQRHLRRAREGYAHRHAQLCEWVHQEFPTGTRVSRPAGGLALWLELPGSADTTQLFYEAREAGIHFSPGELFATDSRFRHCLRLIFAQPWTTERRRAIRWLGDACKRQLDG